MMKRRDLLRTAPVLAAAAGPLFGADAPKLPSAVIDESKAQLTHEPFGDQRIYFEGPTGQVRSMTAGSLRLKPGMSPHPPHQHPEEEFMVITEGTAEITVEGEPFQVGPGSMMYCAGGRLHGVTNTGKTPMLFYFYKWKA
jgi:quercetin dioxygenase-like cupin family protein